MISKSGPAGRPSPGPSVPVGDLVAEFLEAIGVDTVFGVVSVHNIPILDAIGRRNAIRFVMGRGETGAGHMADAYARVSGKPGVLITSTGPGAANAVGALVEAGFAGTPMLHLTGQTASAYLDRGQGLVHDVPDQLGMLRSVSKAAFRVRSADLAFGTLVKSASLALGPPAGPVSIEIPIDIQRESVRRPGEIETLTLPTAQALPGAERGLDAIAARVAGAKRPLLWTGNGAKHAREAVQRWVDLGIPLATSWNGRGVLPETHPQVLGPLATLPEVLAWLQSVDLMVIAGCRLRGQETADMSLALPGNRIQIDVDPAASGRTYAAGFFHVAEAGAALHAVADRLEQGPLAIDSGFVAAAATVKKRAVENYIADLGAYREFPARMRAVMPADAVWVRDVTLANSTWGNRILPVCDPRHNVYPVSAAIGPGLPFGIGASIGARGRKVVAMCGDGGFCLGLAEIWTAVQERADVVFVVMNDSGYGVIRHIQDALYEGRHFYGDLLAPDWEHLARLVGIPFGRVRAPDQLDRVMRTALAAAGPALVEVDMAAIGAYPRYFQPPPYSRPRREAAAGRNGGS